MTTPINDGTQTAPDGLTRDQRAVAIAAARAAAPAFEAQGWKWKVRDGKSVEPFVPDQQAIEQHVIQMLSQVINDQRDGGFNLSCGRFRVSREFDPPHVIYGVDLVLANHWEDR